MKVFIIVAMTADGYIGRDATHLTDWSSHEDKVLFVRLTKEAGTIVFGNKAFQTIGKALPKRRNIVMSRSPQASIDGVEFTSEQPRELISRLEKEGVETLAVCGGREIYDLFLQAGVVNEIYITLEPILFGSGVTLFSSETETRLELLNTEKLNDNTVLLHYKVLG